MRLNEQTGPAYADMPPDFYNGALIFFGVLIAIAIMIILWMIMGALDCFEQGEEYEEIQIRRHGRVDRVYRVMDHCRHTRRDADADGCNGADDERNKTGSGE